MQYLLMIYQAQKTEHATPELLAEYGALMTDVRTKGQWVAGEALQWTDTATTVRVRDGKAAYTDGPFAETKEILSGFFLVDVANLDEALAIAARIPSAKFGSIEVRPILQY